ncbi:MAG: N-carbamoylputrescine amidase [Myxococcota bacterium]
MSASNELRVAVIQCALGDGRDANVDRVEGLVRRAAADGAGLVLPPELFEGPYFPQHEREEAFALAHPVEGHPTLARFSELARELGVVLPVSFFERAGQSYFNSVVVLDADGRSLGRYRKSHIPDGPGYEEKFYFRPGGGGFRCFDTRVGRIGVGLCWDQWFPEAARAMALLGAEILLYPTAIGSEPAEPENDTRDPWQRVMAGHAVANAMPVAAANRVGVEEAITFYGSSFICDGRGAKVAELDRAEEGVALASFDRDALVRERAGWGFFRDRRPELYGVLAATDGEPAD